MAAHRICLLFALLLGATYFNTADAVVVNVGGSGGWTVGGPSYDVWASQNPVKVGDTLVFTYDPARHNVEIFPSATAYAACDFTDATTLPSGTTGSTYTVNSTTPVYFGCGISGHCQGGQKVNITAVATNSSPPGSPSIDTVICWSTRFGDGCVPSNYSTANYSSTIFSPGTIVAFNFTASYHNLYTVPTQAAFDSCDLSAATVIVPSNSNAINPALYSATLTAPVTYFVCGVADHCSKGQKVALKTSSSVTAPPMPSSNSTTPSTSPPMPSSNGTTPSTSPPPPAPNGTAAPPPPSSASKLVPGAAIMAFAVLIGLQLL